MAGTRRSVLSPSNPTLAAPGPRPAQPGLLAVGRSVLLLLDLQPSARLTSAEHALLGERVAKLARAAATSNVPVIASLLPAPRGDGLDDTVAQSLPTWAVVENQQTFDALATPRIAQALAMTGRQQIVIGGLETHSSVLQTAYQARTAGYTPFVVADAVAAQNAEASANALTRLGGDGISVTHTESVLAEWLASSDHPACDASAAADLP